MSSSSARGRCRERVLRLAGANLDDDTLRREAVAALASGIGFSTWGWPLSDPCSLLSTVGLADPAIWPLVPVIVTHQERFPDLLGDRWLLADRGRVESLYRATGGDYAQSRHWREVLRRYGFGDDLRAACVDRGACWGKLRLLRDASDPPFDDEDLELLGGLMQPLGAALRRAAGRRAPASTTAPGAGAAVLDAQLRVMSRSASAHAWIDGFETAHPGLSARCAVLSTAARALRDPTPAAPVRARARLGSGHWAIIEGMRLDNGGAAVLIRPAVATEVLELAVLVFGLTPRETELITQLAHGNSTRTIARRLDITSNTVQQHLKSVFDKFGVHNRHELLTGALGLESEPQPAN